MRAKAVDFEVTYINLREKPDWFLKISPHGKVPVLLIDEQPLFESNAIAEYLDEVVAPRLHPEEPFKRARHRAWTDFVPTFAGGLSGVYSTKTKEDVEQRLGTARERLTKLEEAISQERDNEGPFFAGSELCLVDAAYAPFLQRFCLIEQWLKTGVLEEFPLVKAWAGALLADDRIIGSVPDNFAEEFIGNIKRRELYVATLLAAG